MFVLTTLRSALYQRAPDGWLREALGLVELCISTVAVFAYHSSHLLRDSGTGRRFRDIMWTIVISKMKVFIIMAVLDTVQYEVRIYFCVTCTPLYCSPDGMPIGGLGRFCRTSLVLLGFIRQLGIEKALRSSSYSPGFAEAVFHRMEGTA